MAYLPVGYSGTGVVGTELFGFQWRVEGLPGPTPLQMPMVVLQPLLFRLRFEKIQWMQVLI